MPINMKFDITNHSLVPKHSILSEKEKADLLEKYQISMNELPKILKTDPAIRHLPVKEGNIIKIVRESPTAGKVVFFRGVISS